MTTSSSKISFYIVSIGASAGGVEALEQFFQAMPPDNGMAFVIIQHLSPDYKSMMAEILSKYTVMPVREAEDGMQVKPDHVYLIPPKKTMTITEGRLRLTEKNRHAGLTLPIDIFLHSLAKDCGDKAIAVILSGTGSDGTRGIRSIKEAEGMVAVQSRDSAKFDGMPQSAINTGLVDLVLSAGELPEALMKFVRHPVIDASHSVEQRQTGEYTDVVACVLNIIKGYTNVDFHQYKRNTVLRRIERRAGLQQCHDVAEYLLLLQESEDERKTLYNELLIGVTKFFRNPDTFERLRQTIIPQLFVGKQLNEAVRVWVAGCSTGEEAYSLAILFTEHCQRMNLTHEIKIFATDIDANALQFAANGEYSESTVVDVTPERLAQFFIKRNNNVYVVGPEIRKKVVFAQHDLTNNPPFNRLDLISCRNLFIYLQPSVQERILHLFHFALNQQGYLFLGESESIGESGATVFTTEDSHHRFYRARTGITPSLPRWRDMPALPPISPAPAPPVIVARSSSRQVGDYLQKLLLDKFVPACLLINDNLDVLYISRRANVYLDMEGPPEYNLLRMLPDSISAYARTAVNNALKHRKTVIYKATLDTHVKEPHYLNLHVEPLPHKQSGMALLLLTFEETSPPEVAEAPIELAGDARQYLEEIEKELNYTRETLQATIEELETSNEELQSTNEELLAANEELQSTNEELQAVNEELVTVNSEHQHKIHELEQLNETMDNLLRCSRVGTLFLDQELCIRRFTPAISEEIHLRDSDIGRPLADFRHHLDYPNLYGDLRAVMRENRPHDVEVQGIGGKWYLMQMSPYLTLDGRVEGCALNLVDITKRKQTEKQVQQAQERLQLALESNEIGVWELDLHTQALTWDDTMFHLYQAIPENFCFTYDAWQCRVHPDDVVDAEAALQAVIEGKEARFDKHFRIVLPDDSIRHIQAYAKVSYDSEHCPISMLGVNRDVTHEFENARILHATQHLGRIGGWELDVTSMNVVWTEEVYRIHELEPNTSIDVKSAIDFYHPDDQPLIQAAVEQCITNGTAYDLECRFITAKGNQVWVRAMGEAEYVRNKVVKLHGLFQSITERKKVEEELRRAKEVAESANRAKSAFLANMSHELRTPLTAVMGYAQILAKANDLNEKYHRMAQSINRSGEHLLTLLNDVLDLAKVEAGRFELNLEDSPIQSLMQNITDIFQVRAAQKNLQFDWQIQAGVPAIVKMDSRRVRQVLLNLLGNAVKFTEAGHIDLHCSYENNWLYFTVQDTGIGIAASELQQIFEPFQQVGEARYKIEGTGLGLSICHRLTDLMGGTLHVDSKLGQGSIFSLKIPVKSLTNDKTSSAIPTMETARITSYKRLNGDSPFKLLLVDDIHDNLEILQTFLKPIGFEIYLAESGEQCLQLVSELDFDLIFMDIRMPGISGLDCTRKIREMNVTIPIIAVTASVLEDERQTFIEVGCNDVIAKPVKESDVFGCLAKHLALEWKQETVEDNPIPQCSLSEEHKSAILTLVNMGDASRLFQYIEGLIEQPELSVEAKILYGIASTFQFDQLKLRLQQADSAE